MDSTHPAAISRRLATFAPILALGACATADHDRPEARVRLVAPYEHASAADASSMLAGKYARLAQIDPLRPVTDDTDTQTLSLFGREDLIAGTSSDYAPEHCAGLKAKPGVLAEIETRARRTSIVIINESHERSEHRGFSAEVARRLRPLGYDTLAMEALSNSPPGTPARYRPTFVTQPNLPYLVDGDGYYLSEAGFGRLGRLSKALGYRLLPYEPNEDVGPPPGLTREERIARREEGQARNLAAFVRAHPGARMLVHVGYSHVAEVPRADGARWMAARLRQMTGIDPLTISQTVCLGGGDRRRLSALPADQPTGTVDLVVDHPTARFARHRPVWRMRAGDIMIGIPENLRPVAGWRVVEARPVGEPAASVPMDRVAIRPGEDVALALPPGRYTLRIVDPAPGGKIP